jgi:putative membrane protein
MAEASSSAPPATVNTSTELALDRTYLAHDRTLMAWTRTAASLISFGFTIYKFFDAENRGKQHHPLGYITFSLTMISIGLISLTLATYQHHRDTSELVHTYHLKRRSLATITAGLIALLGILGFLAVVLRQ